MMVMNEAHLLNTRGQNFRVDFQQIGWVCTRLEHRIPMIAVTTTLHVGGPTNRVRKLLEFKGGRHHVIRRSSYRPDIKLIFRATRSGL
ncbi:hypothetical protein J3A83DRAFT_1097972 [Scleroderma citrinum]